MNSSRTLVAPELFERLAARVAKDEGIDVLRAERVVEQALVFLTACSQNPGGGLTPSEAVDPGWHAFILHTREYATFCTQIAGRFIHHTPTVGDAPPGSPPAETVASLRATGYEVDDELWGTVAAADCSGSGTGKCSQCHAGCVDSP